MDAKRSFAVVLAGWLAAAVSTAVFGQDSPAPKNGSKAAHRGAPAGAEPFVFPKSADWRRWTDVTGKYSIEARFFEWRGDQISLQQRDGNMVKIRAEKLSDQDRDFAQKARISLALSRGQPVELDWAKPPTPLRVEVVWRTGNELGRVSSSDTPDIIWNKIADVDTAEALILMQIRYKKKGQRGELTRCEQGDTVSITDRRGSIRLSQWGHGMEGLWLDRYVVGGTVSIAIVKVVSVKVLSPSEVQTDYMGLGGALARMGLGPREMEIKMLSNWIEIPFQVEAKKESSVRKKTATDP